MKSLAPFWSVEDVGEAAKIRHYTAKNNKSNTPKDVLLFIWTWHLKSEKVVTRGETEAF